MNKKLIVLIVLAFISITIFAFAEEEKTTFELPLTAQRFWAVYNSAPLEVGRFQIFLSPHNVRNTFLVDTATGLIWQMYRDPSKDKPHFMLLNVEFIYEKWFFEEFNKVLKKYPQKSKEQNKPHKTIDEIENELKEQYFKEQKEQK